MENNLLFEFEPISEDETETKDVSTHPHSHLLPPDVANKGWDTIGHITIGEETFKQFINFIEDNELLQNLTNDKLVTTEVTDVVYNTTKTYIKVPKTDINGTVGLTDAIQLTPGQIIALAGDFYAVPDEPICFGADEDDKKRRFIAAYNTLASAKQTDVDKTLKQAEQDSEKINQAHKKGEKKLSTYINRSAKGIADNLKYTFSTIESSFPLAFWHSRYLDLALKNFDHFGAEAREAYRIGHLVALETATLAHQTDDVTKKYQLLTLALAQELFACHFLTDLFAAGHLRTPRKEVFNFMTGQEDINAAPANLKDASFLTLIASGSLAMKMHDEDGTKGLNVTNRKEAWVAYGDGCYYDEGNKQNSSKVIEAVAASLYDIYLVFNGKHKTEELKDNFQEFLPTAINDTNHPPLLKVDNKDGKLKVFIREKSKNTEQVNYRESKRATFFNHFNVKAHNQNQDHHPEKLDITEAEKYLDNNIYSFGI